MLNKTIQLYYKSFAGLSSSIWLLSLVTLINRSGTMVIPFLTIYLTTQRGFTLVEAGWIMACFGLGSVLGTWLGGWLTDRLGFYPVAFWSLLLSGVMFFVLQQMENFIPICITIFLLTTIADAFRPASMTSIAVYSTSENRTRSVSLVRLAINLGFTIGPAVGGLIAASIGYDWLFWIDGVTCIGAAFFFRIYLEEKEDVPTPTEEETTKSHSVQKAHRDRPFMFFFFMMVLSAFAFLPFFHAVPVYFRQDLMLNEAQIGGLLAINGLLIAVVEMPLVYTLQDRFPHLRMVGLGILLIGLSYLIFNIFIGWWFAALLAVIAITFGEIFNLPFANTFALNRSSPGNRGEYMALYANAYSIAHVISPIIGLRIAAFYGFATLWYLLAIVCLLAFVGLVFLERKI